MTMTDGGSRGLLWRVALPPALAAMVLHALLVTVYVRKHDGDLGTLVCVGPHWFGRPPYEAIRRPVGNGYDGQHYYAIAQAPWRPHRGDIDSPVRHLRILYPALCWLCSGGSATRLLWVMPALNVAAIGGIAGVGAWLAGRRGMSGWWGFLLPLALDAGLPTLRNLSDTVSTLALCGLLAAWLLQAPGWAMLLWAAAALGGREQNLAVVLVVFGASLWNRRLGSAAGVGAALVSWGAWFGVLWASYGKRPFLSASHHFTAPLTGLWYCASHLGGTDHSLPPRLVQALLLAHLVLQLVLAVTVAIRTRECVLALVLLGGVMLALLAGVPIYEDFWSYGRVLVWVPLGLGMGALNERRGWLLLLLAPAAAGTYAALRGWV